MEIKIKRLNKVINNKITQNKKGLMDNKYLSVLLFFFNFSFFDC